MKAFFARLYYVLFPLADRLQYLEEEVERLRKTNADLLDRLMLVTTGLDRNGKPAVASMSAAPEAPREPLADLKNATNPYRNLAAEEARLFQNLQDEFLGLSQGQSRGFDQGGATPPSNGKIGAGGYETEHP